MTTSLAIINFAISAAGLVVCILGLIMAITGSAHEERIKRYFITFFFFLTAYVAANLIGQLWTNVIFQMTTLFLESAFSSVLTLLLAGFLLEQSGEAGWPRSPWFRAALGLWLAYIALLVYTQFSTAIYYFDARGLYHRGPYYPVLLVPPACIMLLNLLVLWRRRERFSRKQRIAFAVYILVPLLTMLVQMLFFGLYVIVLGTAVSALFMLLYIQRDQAERYARQEAENARLRMDIMLSQIQPHFLYNSLGSIQQLYRKDPQAADSAMQKFTRYLRANMDSLSHDAPIPFARELEHAKTYLELEQLRFGDELKIVYDLAGTSFLLPTLTLQPLAENAVRHGVRRKADGCGTVTVSTREYPDRWEVTVSDDGPGFDPDVLPDDGRPHLGLTNIRARLERCGDRLHITSRPGQGTDAVIVIPKDGGGEIV